MVWIAAAAAASLGSAALGGMSGSKGSKNARKEFERGVTRTEDNTNLRGYSQGGAGAFNQAQALLGVGGRPNDYQAYYSQNPDLQAEWAKNPKLRAMFGNDPAKYAADHYKQFGQAEGREIKPQGGDGQEGFQNYLDSAGYKTQMKGGIDALNSNAAARGMLQSGATLKATQRFGAGLGQQYFNNYIGQLMGQASMGQSSDRTLADVYTGAAEGKATGQISGAKAKTDAFASAGKTLSGAFGQYGGAPAPAPGTGTGTGGE